MVTTLDDEYRIPPEPPEEQPPIDPPRCPDCRRRMYQVGRVGPWVCDCDPDDPPKESADE